MSLAERAAPRVAAPFAALQRTWDDRPGIPGALESVDHKRIGKRYLVTAFTFLLVGGVEALLMRLQLAGPDADVVGPQAYNELMTMHGTTMIFLFNTPVFAGFGNYVLPLHVGTRDMAFPRLNALSYWIYLSAGLLLYSSFLFGDVPEGGWFAYVPLSGDRAFTGGLGMDFWAVGIAFLGVSTTVGAINFLVTAIRMRTPGMTWPRVPVFVWGVIVMSLMIVFALPAITLAGVTLEADRNFGFNFFDPSAGGQPILYQHLFWIWGHPEVYLLFIPATGIVSTIIPVFCRRRLVGYPLVVASLVATGFISFGLWLHHMFATGVPALTADFFSVASALIAIPTGVQFFAWVSTIATAPEKPRLEPPMLFAIGFLVTFLIGGMTGVMVAMVPFDWAAHDSYFVVAHFHYVLFGGTVFPTFAGLHFWFPKMTGRMLDRRKAVWSFWLIFVGFHVTFFPQHILGLMGMPRRVYTYTEGYGTAFDVMNLISSIGGFVIAAGIGLMTWNFLRSRRRAGPRRRPTRGAPTPWSGRSPPPSPPTTTPPSPTWRATPRCGTGRRARPAPRWRWSTTRT